MFFSVTPCGNPWLRLLWYGRAPRYSDTRLVREHQGWRSSDDIGNSVRANGSMLKTRKIPRTISALLLVELSIQEFLFDICHFGSCWE